MRIALGAWRPDLDPASNPGLVRAENCVPVSADSLGHMNRLAPVGHMKLPGRPSAIIPVVDHGGQAFLVAGTSEGLYRISGRNATLEKLSGADVPRLPENQDWCLVRYGDSVIATSTVSRPLVFNARKGGGFMPVAAAPPAVTGAVVRDFLVLGNLHADDGGRRTQRIRWSGIDDPAHWPAPGSAGAAAVQSDYQDLPGSHGEVMAISGALQNADGLVLLRHGVVRMSYIGPPFVFQFDRIEGARGLIAPGAMVQAEGRLFYLSDGGFMACDGLSVVRIGTSVIDAWMRRTLDHSRKDRIQAAADPESGLIFWSFPSERGASGVNDRLLVYHHGHDRWTEGRQDNCGVFQALTPGATLEELDQQYPSVDSMDISLDSPVWVGGRPQVAAFLPGGRIGFFTGEPLVPVIETGEASDPEGRRLFAGGIRLESDWPPEDTLIRPLARETLSVPARAGPAVSPGADGRCTFRTGGRYLSFRATLRRPRTFRALRGALLDITTEGKR